MIPADSATSPWPQLLRRLRLPARSLRLPLQDHSPPPLQRRRSEEGGAMQRLVMLPFSSCYACMLLHAVSSPLPLLMQFILVFVSGPPPTLHSPL